MKAMLAKENDAGGGSTTLQWDKTIWKERLREQAANARSIKKPFGQKIVATPEMGLPKELTSGILGDGYVYGTPVNAIDSYGE